MKGGVAWAQDVTAFAAHLPQQEFEGAFVCVCAK